MKKFLCLILAFILTVCTLAAFPMNTAAATAANTLTVTCHGQVLGEVEVGNEFIYHVAMNSGGLSIWGGEAEVNYDDAYVQVVEYGTLRSNGSVNMSEYCFPARIINSSLAADYLGTKNQINYNFAKVGGVGAFTEDDSYFKIRFKAIAPGTVEIRHYARSFYSGLSTRLFRNDKGNEKLDPIPYTLCSIEPATAFIGDADGDYNLTVMDATYIQWLTAGLDSTYSMTNTDVNTDGDVNLRDALCILRYKAGVATGTDVGKWIFDSEA